MIYRMDVMRQIWYKPHQEVRAGTAMRRSLKGVSVRERAIHTIHSLHDIDPIAGPILQPNKHCCYLTLLSCYAPTRNTPLHGPMGGLERHEVLRPIIGPGMERPASPRTANQRMFAVLARQDSEHREPDTRYHRKYI